MYILAIIPARGGSKSIPRKNIKDFCGYPLIYWSIKQAKESKHITRIIVSTDDEEIKEISLKYGAEVPFLRPKSISDDLSTDYEFMEHCLTWLSKNENNQLPDLIVQLRPTYPTRKVSKIDECIEIMINNLNYDSLRSVIAFDKSPYKMYRVINNALKPLFEECDQLNEPYNRCRQELPQTYLHNGYIDIIKTDTIIQKKSITGYPIYPYIMNKEEYHDIDTINDWNNAEKINND